MQFTAFSEAAESMQTLAGSEKQGKVQIGSLKNDEALEMEFRFISFNNQGPNPEDNSMLQLVAKQNNSAGDGKIIVKNMSGRWCLFYYPPGSKNYARKYYVYIPMKETGTNEIRIERRDDWASYYINNVFLGGIPLQSDVLTQMLVVDNLDMKYSGKHKILDKHPAKNSNGSLRLAANQTKPPAGKKPYRLTDMYWNIPGGHFKIFDTKQVLNDGEKVRISVEVIQAYQDPKWSSSVAIRLDEIQFWINKSKKDDSYKLKYDKSPDVFTLKKERISFDKKPNIIELARKGNRISMTINGESIGSFTHNKAPEYPTDYLFGIKVVGMEVRFSIEKVEN
jgi:hypothetical protein